MKANTRIRLLVIFISLGFFLISCTPPTEDMGIPESYSDINIVSLDGSGHRVISGDRTHCGAVLPTKSGIIYENGNLSLYKMNYDGSNQSRLYPDILWDARCFSPDESKILLSSGLFEYGQYLNTLYLMNTDGSTLLPLAPQKGQYLFPHISPNLDEIVFLRDGGIATINVDGTGLRSVRTKSDSTSCMHGLYVDEDRILYVEWADSIFSLRLFDKTNHQDKRIGPFPSGLAASGRVLVNGKLLYVDLGMIKVMDVYTSGTSTLSQGSYASYSSDGSRIVYSNGRSICTMDGKGGNQQTIYTEHDPTKYIGDPQFSVDDKMIVFTTSYSAPTP